MTSNLENAYLCIVAWTNGETGFFVKAGSHVPIKKTLEEARTDYGEMCRNIKRLGSMFPQYPGTKIQLVRLKSVDVLDEYTVPKSPPPPIGPVY